MATNGVVFNPNITSNYTNANTSSAANRTPGGELGQDEFLEILAVQMANQDPLEPVSDTDFIAQMAQFSALEQMSALNETFASTQAYSLVGKDVAATLNINGINQTIYGKVAGVVKQSGKDYLQIGDFLVSPSAVQAVYNDTAMDGLISQAASLVGKTVTAEVPDPTDEDPSHISEVTGTVSAILVKNGALYAKIEDKEVPVAYITEIS